MVRLASRIACEAMFLAPVRSGRRRVRVSFEWSYSCAFARSRHYLLVALAASLWSGLLVSGCSQNDAVRPNAEVSPFDPKPPGSEKASLPDGIKLPGVAAAKTARPMTRWPGLTEPGKSTLDTSFRRERRRENPSRRDELRPRKGEMEKADPAPRPGLGGQPTNREALMARGAGAIEQWRTGKRPRPGMPRSKRRSSLRARFGERTKSLNRR